MIRLLRLTATSISDKAQLIIKAISARYTYTAPEYGSYGTDSRPVKDTSVAYSTTQIDGAEIILGCLNKNRKAEEGEHRLFCTDKDGVFKFNIWLRADGTLLQGNSEEPADYTNFATKYNESLQELNKIKSTLNTLVNNWNAFVLAYVPGSPSTVGTPPTLSGSDVPVNTSDFTLIKNENIKTN